MSETVAAATEPSRKEAPAPDTAFHPVDVLLHVIATFLAPMFLTASGGDIGFARMAALETVNAYRVRGPADLIPIAQMIAFGLAALGSLSLSMADDLSLGMTLRLRGNANACDRSAERNRRVLRESEAPAVAPLRAPIAPDPDSERHEAELVARVAATQQRARAIQAQMAGAAPAQDQAAASAPVASPVVAAPASVAAHAAPQSVAPTAAPPSVPAPAIPSSVAPVVPHSVTPGRASAPASAVTPAATAAQVAAPARQAAPAPEAAPMMTKRQMQAMWGAAMADVAAEYTADLPRLSPEARRDAMLRANALNACASHLISGQAPPRPRPVDPVSDRREA
jgi:hypothetical protein